MKETLTSSAAAAASCVFLSLTPATLFAQVYPTWAFQPGGFYYPGRNGIVFANVDGTGLEEIIVSGTSVAESGGLDGLAIVEYRDGAYVTSSVKAIGVGGGSWGGIRKADGPTGQDGIVLAHPQGSQLRLMMWTGKPLEQVANIAAPAQFYLSQVADVDADGRLEALGFVRSFSAPLAGTGPAILIDLESGNEKWRSNQDVSNVAAGQLDADPALEIVMGGTNSGFILDGATRIQQWDYPDGFDGKTVFGNFWGTTDAREFVQMNGYNKIFVSQPFFSPTFEFLASSAIFSVNDLNNDQYDDLILHDGNFDALRAFSTRTGIPFFQWINPEVGSLNAVAAGNADGMGGQELAIGGQNSLYVVSAETGRTQYLSKKTIGPYSNLHLADVQGDSHPELVVSVRRGDGAPEQIILLDAETGLEIRRRSSLPFAMPDSAAVLDSFDLEQDGKREIVLGVFQNVALIDGTTLDLRWAAPIEGAGFLRRLNLMRFNTDSVDDIVIVTSERVLILDGRNGSELYRSPVIIDGVANFDIAIGNMDSDPQTEIAISHDQAIHVVDPYSGETRLLHMSPQNVIGLRIEDTGVCSLVMVTKDKLERRSCANGDLFSTRNLPIGDATFVRFAGTSLDDLITSDGQRLYRVRGDEIVARSTLLGTGMGKFNQGVITANGTSITSYLGGDQGVNRVDLPFELLFRDGFDQR